MSSGGSNPSLPARIRAWFVGSGALQWFVTGTIMMLIAAAMNDFKFMHSVASVLYITSIIIWVVAGFKAVISIFFKED